MSLRSYEAVMARLAADPAYSDEVQRRGASALPDDLTDTERDQVIAAACNGQLPESQPASARLLSRLRPLMPLTSAVVPGDLLVAAAERFAVARAGQAAPPMVEAVALCAHLLGEREVREATPFVREVVEYERAVLDLRQAAAYGRAAAVHRVAFDHALRPLVRALVAGGDLSAVPREPCVLEGFLEHGSVHWRRVGR